MFAPRIHKGPTHTLFGSFTVTSAAGLLIDRDTKHQSPQDLEVVVTSLGKTALTHREFREYVAEEEESCYEVYLRYNRTA